MGGVTFKSVDQFELNSTGEKKVAEIEGSSKFS